MEKPTDEDLDYNLRQQGFKTVSGQRNTYWRKEDDGSITTRYTDDDYSRKEDSREWERDYRGRKY